MQPDKILEVLRVTKAVPLTLQKDGAMWWPGGLALDGLRKELRFYRAALPENERPALDEAVETAWRYGEAALVHTLLLSGNDPVRVRLRLRRENEETCAGLLRVIPDEQGSAALPPVGERITRMCGVAAEQLRVVQMDPSPEKLRNAQLLLRRIRVAAEQLRRILGEDAPRPELSPVCTIEAFAEGLRARFARLLGSADQRVQVVVRNPDAELASVDALRCVDALMVCVFRRVGRDAPVTLNLSAEKENLLLVLYTEQPLFEGMELEYVRDGQAAEPSACRIDLLALCAEVRRCGGRIGTQENAVQIRIPCCGTEKSLTVRDADVPCFPEDEEQFALLCVALLDMYEDW